MNVQYYTPEIYVIEDVFSKAECISLVKQAEAIGFEEAKVNISFNVQQTLKGVRNNERIMFTDDELANKLWIKLKHLLPQKIGNSMAIGFNEMFRFYKYSIGQRFKMHSDGSYKRNILEASHYTFILYLNDDFEGGDTIFYTGEVIKPKAGSALVFHHPLKHEGAVVNKGTKYVLRSDIMFKLVH